jgi:hypothetical protein
MIKDESVIGKRFGRTVALIRAGVGSNGDRLWECQCDCGTKHVTSASSLIQGRMKSCGCLRKERLASGDVNRTHGQSETKEYAALYQAKKRCQRAHKNHADYYDRGIRVCSEWSGKGGFEKFIAHIGKCPSSQHSLDRIDNDKGYEPGNVRWATAQEQVDNRRLKRLEQFSDAAFDAEARRRGFVLAPQARVYKAVTFSANAPTVGNVIIVDASK